MRFASAGTGYRSADIRRAASMRINAVLPFAAAPILWASTPDSLCALATCAAQAPAPTSSPALPVEGFRVLETEHFAIAYDTSYDVLRPLVGRLESTYDAVRHFCEDGGLVTEPAPEPLRVLLFDHHETFKTYLGTLGIEAGSLAGVYHQENRIAAFCNVRNSPELAPIAQQVAHLERQLLRTGPDPDHPLSGTERAELRRRLDALQERRDALVGRFNRFVLQHEVAHQILYHMGVHVLGADNPRWLVEGLACQFEIPQTSRRRTMTQINHLRLADFRDALGAGPDAGHYADGAYDAAVAKGHLLPVADLIGEDDPFAVGEPQLAYRYAQAWALVHYLHATHREAFATYVGGLSRRKVGEAVGRDRELEEFRRAFGEPGEAFEHDWLAWVFRLRLDRNEAGR
jgi:hypothetical protein